MRTIYVIKSRGVKCYVGAAYSARSPLHDLPLRHFLPRPIYAPLHTIFGPLRSHALKIGHKLWNYSYKNGD